MTRREITGIRDRRFNDWIRQNMPDSKTGYMATDVDFVLYNYKTKNVVILEVKTRNGDVYEWQKIFYKNLDKWIRKGISDDWTYHGVHLIQFENTCFDDGKCFLDREEISEQEFINRFSFNN